MYALGEGGLATGSAYIMGKYLQAVSADAGDSGQWCFCH